MKIVVLLALVTAGEASSSVVARSGHSITLPCHYDITTYSRLSGCWGRGQLPLSGCGDQLVSTDGLIESSRASSRYRLLGRLDRGNVSLTILNVSASDSGRYGCRVEIPGLLNDHKHHFDLSVEAVVMTTISTTVTMATSTDHSAAMSTTGQLTITDGVLTSSSSSLTAKQSGDMFVVLVCVLFGLVAVVTAGGLIIIFTRWRRLNKLPQQQVSSWAQFSSSYSLHLQSRAAAMENIYQVDGDGDGDGDGGEYEYCP